MKPGAAEDACRAAQTSLPFLTFAIGVSHAVQNINTMAAERLHGASNIEAAKATFRLLFIPGTIALLCDAVGFSTLLVIEIGVIRELAISASIGVAVIIFTKMFLLPILMSYLGISAAGLRRQEQRTRSNHAWARFISRFASGHVSRATVRRSRGMAAIQIARRSSLRAS